MLKQLFFVCSLLFASQSFSADSGLPNPQVVIKTNQGNITVRLFRDKSPVTVANFLSYVDSGHYNGTIFHRVIPNFMVQGGGFLPDMSEKETGDPIVNESKNRLHNIRGTLAMARTNDPDSATAQFFINQRTNLQLDWAPGKPGYTVFGEVTEGMNTVDYMASSPVQSVGPHENVPSQPILIKEIVRKSLL
ncbi:peptidyl-prolyl cis-trans isomerase [Parahaliea sp. F7430]|uniref:Peptidyl-prolyl cis-trans isomerase n=1 Tax=Sediminihaliea albiluteola TaxID=2758564 RepID=A0A7W2YJR1_9GAMM|nr:peptidylprolyl isomerase [Sediminihaliea albiluteola]MBA6412879.1 peptidyl-prolyl cis-trans isomerase [Sediminihaliea albiluteola]